MNGERPWDLAPTPEPNIPGGVQADIASLVSTEVSTMQMSGAPVEDSMVQERMQQLNFAAQQAAKKEAQKEADKASAKLDDILIEGGFYDALVEFLSDLPAFDYACIKGPVVRKTNDFVWTPQGGVVKDTPKMFWYRVSPFDLWFAPGAHNAEDGPIMERIRITRDELYDLIGLPGYNEAYIRQVLELVDNHGLDDWRDNFEAERADLEDRENPNYDFDGPFIDTLEYHGYVRGKWLLDWGLDESRVEDPDKEYYVTAWLIDKYVIKVQLNPNPRKKPIYYVTSFEKVPGSVYGNGLPNILHDLQEVANATLRSLVNNLSISSGPQVVIDEDRLAPGADSDSLYPWKRWKVQSDPYSSNQPPITFYQPDSHAQELLVVYEKFTQIADEISAIPRYLTGSERVGGAASTASGLSMLMNNASKVMQMVAANIDHDIIRPCIQHLYDMVMLTDKGQTLRGDEEIMVKGVTMAVQKEQDRVRQLEFLNMTANPIDQQIIGPQGRAAILRKLAGNLGLDYEKIVPTDEDIQAMLAQVPPGPDAANPSETGEDAQPHLNTQGNARSTVG
jgi:hypothetical protein